MHTVQYTNESYHNHHINSTVIAPPNMQPPISPRKIHSLDKPGKSGKHTPQTTMPNTGKTVPSVDSPLRLLIPDFRLLPRYWQNNNPVDQQPISVNQRSLAVPLLPVPPPATRDSGKTASPSTNSPL